MVMKRVAHGTIVQLLICLLMCTHSIVNCNAICVHRWHSRRTMLGGWDAVHELWWLCLHSFHGCRTWVRVRVQLECGEAGEERAAGSERSDVRRRTANRTNLSRFTTTFMHEHKSNKVFMLLKCIGLSCSIQLYYIMVCRVWNFSITQTVWHTMRSRTHFRTILVMTHGCVCTGARTFVERVSWRWNEIVLCMQQAHGVYNFEWTTDAW